MSVRPGLCLTRNTKRQFFIKVQKRWWLHVLFWILVYFLAHSMLYIVCKKKVKLKKGSRGVIFVSVSTVLPYSPFFPPVYASVFSSHPSPPWLLPCRGCYRLGLNHPLCGASARSKNRAVVAKVGRVVAQRT